MRQTATGKVPVMKSHATPATPLHPRIEPAKRTQKAIARLRAEREAWVAKLEPTALFYRLFDYLPGIHFFAKDARGRLMFASRGLLERYHMRSELEILGQTDFDLNPRLMASEYVADDQRILSGAERHVERLELWWDRQGLPDWYVVTKLPILDRAGSPQGVMGALRVAENHEKQLPVFQVVAKAVNIIRHEYGERISIATVARRCGQSVRQLQRHFQSAFGTTPLEFLLKTRVLSAARLLEHSTLTVSEVAERAGFSDTSSFIEHFRNRVDETPAGYRKRLAVSVR